MAAHDIVSRVLPPEQRGGMESVFMDLIRRKPDPTEPRMSAMMEEIKTPLPTTSSETNARADRPGALSQIVHEVRTFRIMLRDLRQAQQAQPRLAVVRH